MERKRRPFISFRHRGGHDTVMITVHEDVMEEAGFTVGDSVNVHINKELLLITSGDEYTIRKNPSGSRYKHGCVYTNWRHWTNGMPMTTLKYNAVAGYLSAPLRYKKTKKR